LNGEPFEIAGPVTISALLAELNLDPRIVAVEHNVSVIKRQQYDQTMVKEGDEVEIVRFVGGGEDGENGEERSR
jgi:thiamine biosynthesis protein ThiS